MIEVHRRFFKQHDTQEKQEKLTIEPKTDGEQNGSDGAETEVEDPNQQNLSLPDARAHLRAVRAEILTGCCILFSRIISRDMADPSRHPFWQMATLLGAKCVSEQCSEVTHVVAANHTEKTNWALRLGKLVVTPDWLMCCAFTWEHVDEARFPLVDDSKRNTVAKTVGLLGNDDAADVAAALAAAGGGGSG